MNRKLPAVVVGSCVVLLCAACGSSSPKPSTTSSTASTATPSATPTATSSSTPGSTPSSGQAAAATPTRAQVEAAMLVAGDVPAGYKLMPNDDDDNITGSGPNASCDDLSRVINTTALPGSAFEVDRVFDDKAGDEIDVSVAPYKSAEAAKAMARRIGTDATKCPRLTEREKGTSITFTLAVATPPSAGTDATAVTFTGTGNIAGLVETNTTVLDGSTVIGISAPTVTEANLLTALAVSRLDQVLGSGTA